MAEGDRDVYRRSQAALAREKEIMKDVDGWEVGYPLLGPALLSALGGVLSSSVALAEMNGSPSADRQICLQHQEVHAIDYCCLIESSYALGTRALTFSRYFEATKPACSFLIMQVWFSRHTDAWPELYQHLSTSVKGRKGKVDDALRTDQLRYTIIT